VLNAQLRRTEDEHMIYLLPFIISKTKYIENLYKATADAIPMTSKILSFSGRVAVITGGGGGLGEKYAIDLAKRGASVVINDVAESADRVHALVKRICSDGGIAKANINSVLDGKQIIDDAINHFGGCDILVNNAGILRDKSFHKMTKQEWNSVIDVHLQGTFELCHSGIKIS
jgi:NAD(P)-dependent dehydrogenase (short-subunit alcohol dehydrogenase family)